MTAGDLVRTLDSTATVTAVAFDTAGSRIAIGNSTGTVTVTALTAADPAFTVAVGHPVSGLRFVSGGPLLVLTPVGSFAYDAGTGTPGPHAAVDAAIATLDRAGRTLLAVGAKRDLAVVDPVVGTTTLRLTLDLEAIALAWSPDSSALAVSTKRSDGDGSIVRLVDAATGGERARYVHDYPVEELAFTADGTGLVVPSTDGIVSLLDAATGTPSWTQTLPNATMAVVLGPSGQWGAFGLGDSTARVLRMSLGTEHRNVPLRQVPFGMVVSPDGRYLAVAEFFGNLDVVELASGTRVFDYGTTGDIPTGQDTPGLAFTPDSRLLGLAAGSSVLLLDTQ